MDIGTRITKRIDEGGFKQSALAAQYVERAKARGVSRNPNTVESHLSRLKSSDRTAVQFFFSELRDAEDLLEILAVPVPERVAMRDAANDVLAPEERPLRLVVDLTEGPQDAAFVGFCECVSGLIAEAPPRVALVMTGAQHEYLLPKYAPESRVHVEVVRDPSAGEAKARALAGDAAFVASTWRFSPLSHWVAVSWPTHPASKYVLEPANAIELLRQGLPLPGDESATRERDLDTIAPGVEAVAPPAKYASNAPALRRLIIALMNGEGLETEARVRQAWARHLGVRAVGTHAEWVAHLVAMATKAGAIVVPHGNQTTLADEITKAERGAKTPRVVVDTATVHVINPTPGSEAGLGRLAGMKLHSVQPRQSAMRLLRDALKTTTRQALLDDPYLARVIDALAAGGGDRAELQFAAACLLANDDVKVSDGPRLRTWDASLRALLALDPPAAGIRVVRGMRYENRREFGVISLLAAHGSSVSGKNAETIAVPPAEPLRVGRGETLLLGTPATDDRVYPPTVKTRLPRNLRFDDGLAVFEAFLEWQRKAGQERAGDPWNIQPVMFSSDFWGEVDRYLAVTWLALRRASRRADALTLHDGIGVIEMGGGLVAEVSAYEVPLRERTALCDAELFIPLVAPVDRYAKSTEVQATALLTEIHARSAVTDGHVTRTQAHVPLALYLAHENVRFVITFRATPWEFVPSRTDGLLVDAAAREQKRRSDAADAWDDYDD